MSHGGAHVKFRHVLESEIPPEWRVQDPAQVAQAGRASGGMQEGQLVTSVVCVEVPDLMPVWAYMAWARSRTEAVEEVPIMLVALDFVPSRRIRGSDSCTPQPTLPPRVGEARPALCEGLCAGPWPRES